MHNISKKTCFPSTRKVLDFDLNGQHMRKTEVPEGNWVLGCSPDHSTIRPKILSLKSQSSPKDKSERLASRRNVVSSGFYSFVVLVFLLILNILAIYFVQDCRYSLGTTQIQGAQTRLPTLTLPCITPCLDTDLFGVFQ